MAHEAGKGSRRRPTNEQAFSDGWERIKRNDLLGISQTGKAESSNLSTVGSSPTSPAIYIDAESGKEVTEDYWPDIK